MAQSGQHDGFYCKVCDCTVKDSNNYLEHVNGKKHNKALGISLTKFTDSTLDEVKAMYEEKKKERAEKAMMHVDEERLPNLYVDEDADETENAEQNDVENSTDDDNEEDGYGEGDDDDDEFVESASDEEKD